MHHFIFPANTETAVQVSRVRFLLPLKGPSMPADRCLETFARRILEVRRLLRESGLPPRNFTRFDTTFLAIEVLISNRMGGSDAGTTPLSAAEDRCYERLFEAQACLNNLNEARRYWRSKGPEACFVVICLNERYWGYATTSSTSCNPCSHRHGAGGGNCRPPGRVASGNGGLWRRWPPSNGRSSSGNCTKVSARTNRGRR